MTGPVAAHVYDSTNPIDSLGNGAGGQGTYMLVGDIAGGTNDDKYSGYLIFNTAQIGCDPARGVSNAILCVYHYGTGGTAIWNYINVSLINKSSSTLASTDYQSAAESADFYRMNVSTVTDSKDQWACFSVTAQVNTSVKKNFPFMGFRFNAQWYNSNSAPNAIYFSTTSVNGGVPYINYTCSQVTTTTLSSTTSTSTSSSSTQGTTTSTVATTTLPGPTTTSTSTSLSTSTTSSTSTSSTQHGSTTSSSTSLGSTTSTVAPTTQPTVPTTAPPATTQPVSSTTTTPGGTTTTLGSSNGDANGDGHANYLDLLILAASYGKRTGDVKYDARADYNKDGIVDYRDLLVLASHYDKTH